jgi:hypothetical protein
MSRSYKKYTCYDNDYSKAKRRFIKSLKRTNNRILSNAKEVKNGGYYKKIKGIDYYDYYHRDNITLESIVIDYLEDGKSPEEAYIHWIKECYYK